MLCSTNIAMGQGSVAQYWILKSLLKRLVTLNSMPFILDYLRQEYNAIIEA